ncbi:MAG: hypothetical protein HWD58_00910 [Bacteroidota bacterium]|nr:MAG: hypothetical protein HWD58_00910 [Bacteroidota bacterium]
MKKDEVVYFKLLSKGTWQLMSTEFESGQLYCNQCPQFKFVKDSRIEFNGRGSNLKWRITNDSLYVSLYFMDSNTLSTSNDSLKEIDFFKGNYKIVIYKSRKKVSIYGFD